jgi:hypothetical protein
MGVGIDVINPLGVEGRGSADDTMDFVSLLKEEFCKIRSILTSDACNKSAFHFWEWEFGPRPELDQDFLTVSDSWYSPFSDD